MSPLPSLPRVSLAHLPTPVEPLPRLSDQLGLTLLVKRDDQTGLAFGGNKTRKLELLAAQAQAEGATRLLTTGAVQSNHCRQTAAAAARLGLACTLVLAGPPETASGNLLLDRLLGAEVVWSTRERREADLQAAFEAAQAAGERPFLIPYGGSNATGAAAYAYALEELLAQGVMPDYIVLASSSGGTQAGLVAGARLLGYSGRILGISVDEPARVLRPRVADLAREVCARLGTPQAIPADEVWVEDAYAAPGYGVLTAREVEAIHTFARLEGLLLDPVYTGRAASGLLDLARQGVFPPGSTVLFWHTGGTPGLFATRYRDGLLEGQMP